MQPEDRRYAPYVPARNNATSPQARDTSEYAANIVRNQIDQIYASDAQASASGAALAPNNPNVEKQPGPYQRTHKSSVRPQAGQWQQYHSAWQNYYQQYYERYYISHLHQAKKELTSQAGGDKRDAEIAGGDGTSIGSKSKLGITRNQAVRELQSQLVRKVRTSAHEVRKSRHFIPLISAICVVLLFTFLQYNRVLISNVKAYVSPGNIEPHNLVVDPTKTVAVGPEPKLIIPKINVDVPVMYGVGADHDSQMAAMEKGVAHFAIPGANSVPGQIGNTAIAGHSSNDLFDRGDHKFIFAQLDRLTDGDTIYANYEGTRYTYVVTKKEEVMPSQIDKLIYDTDKPVMTLITCTPLGTDLRRLLVTAEQVSPSPREALAAPKATAESTEEAPMPGNSRTLLERLFRG